MNFANLLRQTFVTVILAAALLTSGCTVMRTGGNEFRDYPTELRAEDAIAIVAGKMGKEFSTNDEGKVSECITDAVRRAHPLVKVVSPDDFRRRVFPGVPVKAIPPKAWEELLENRGFRQQVISLAIRYLILISGDSDWNVGLTLGVPALAGRRESLFQADIWDVEHHHRSGRIQAYAIGEWIILAFPVPFWYFSPTKSEACTALGIAVAKFLAGEESAQHSASPALGEVGF